MRSVEQKLGGPAINLRVGMRYLHDLLALFADDLELALALQRGRKRRDAS